MLYRVASSLELLTAGLAQVVLGVAAVLGLVLADRATNRVDWSAAGTWVWIGAFVAIACAGLGLILLARTTHRQGEPVQRAKQAVTSA